VTLQRRIAAMMLTIGCGLTAGCGFTVPQVIHTSYLLPNIPESAAAAERQVVEEGAVVHALEGLRIRVEPMTDAAVNALFPEDSAKERFSTNPYTYGNWTDPLVGYTPNRFTVFKVSVINDVYAKVLLDPLKALLYTDQGEVLHSYGIPSFSPHQSFERYYRAIRGQSGNEFYRFDLRMGNVRSSAYLEDQIVFKGESYSGLIAFDPLDEDVARVRLVLEDFVLRFDAAGQPLESMDVSLEFDRRIDRGETEAAQVGEG